MNVEDEFFSVIEKRDTDLMLKDKKIAEQNTLIAEQLTYGADMFVGRVIASHSHN